MNVKTLYNGIEVDDPQKLKNILEDLLAYVQKSWTNKYGLCWHMATMLGATEGAFHEHMVLDSYKTFDEYMEEARDMGEGDTPHKLYMWAEGVLAPRVLWLESTIKMLEQ